MIPVESFEEITKVFIVDNFDWQIPGLIAETYVRHRQHVMADDSGQPYGRLHSEIAPVFDQIGSRFYQFTLTARSAPTIQTFEDIKNFIDRAHDYINTVFIHSVDDRIRIKWREYDGE